MVRFCARARERAGAALEVAAATRSKRQPAATVSRHRAGSISSGMEPLSIPLPAKPSAGRYTRANAPESKRSNPSGTV